MSDTIQLTAPVEIQAASATQKTPTIDAVVYTGRTMLVSGFGNVAIDLSGLETPAVVPVVADHATNLANILGHAIPTKSGGRLTARGEIIADNESARQVLALAKWGFSFRASVGMTTNELRRVGQNESAIVNGHKLTGPFTLVSKGVLKEISVVALGADGATQVSISAAYSGAENMSANISESDIINAERQRLVAVDRACSGHWGKDSAKVSTLRAKCVAGEMELPDLQGELLTMLRAARPTGDGLIAGSDRPAESNVLEAALCLSAGMSESFVGEQYGENVTDVAVSRPMRGLGIHSVLRSVLRAAGQQVPEKFTAEGIRAAFTADRMLQAGGFSTLSLPGILGNVAGKQLLESYLSVATSWQLFCSVAIHSDFKAATKYRLTGSGAFSQVGPGGELKHITHGEESFSNQLQTQGGLISLTRQNIIDDDLDALGKTPRILGRMAAVALDKSVYSALLGNAIGTDSNAFFSTAHNNYSTSDGALDVDALTAMEKLFFELTDSNGDPILIEPAVLLVPPALAVTATLLMSSLEIRDTTASTKTPTENPHRGKFQAVTSPWLTNANLTNNSDTGYYLLAKPSDIAVIEVAFLDGNQNPVVESGDVDFQTLGMAWRSYFDWGVALADYRAGVFFDGTS